MNTKEKNYHTENMKKSLILVFSLLSVISLAAVAGCEKGDGRSNMEAPENFTEIIALDEENSDGAEEGTGEDTNGCPEGDCKDGTCPDGDCGKRAPKKKFRHKHGRPVKKEDLN